MLIQLRRGFSDPNFEKCGDSEFDKFVAGIVRSVAELPDRTSPEDQPEMMLVSAEELRAILNDNFQRIGLAAAGVSSPANG